MNNILHLFEKDWPDLFQTSLILQLKTFISSNHSIIKRLSKLVYFQEQTKQWLEVPKTVSAKGCTPHLPININAYRYLEMGPDPKTRRLTGPLLSHTSISISCAWLMWILNLMSQILWSPDLSIGLEWSSLWSRQWGWTIKCLKVVHSMIYGHWIFCAFSSGQGLYDSLLFWTSGLKGAKRNNCAEGPWAKPIEYSDMEFDHANLHFWCQNLTCYCSFTCFIVVSCGSLK